MIVKTYQWPVSGLRDQFRKEYRDGASASETTLVDSLYGCLVTCEDWHMDGSIDGTVSFLDVMQWFQEPKATTTVTKYRVAPMLRIPGLDQTEHFRAEVLLVCTRPFEVTTGMSFADQGIEYKDQKSEKIVRSRLLPELRKEIEEHLARAERAKAKVT